METDSRLVDRVAERAQAAGITVAVAESLTGGELAAHLATGESASTWFAGGVVSYSSEVKQRVLGVPVGPVVSETAARAMAEGVADLLGADATVAVTGVGGPGSEENQPAGTVWWAVRSAAGTTAGCERFEGTPPEVISATVDHALEQLLAAIEATVDGSGG